MYIHIWIFDFLLCRRFKRTLVNCTGVRSCYDEGKRAAETLCFDYKRTHDVDIRVIRIQWGPKTFLFHNTGHILES